MSAAAVYGRPPRGLVEVPEGAVQVSPLVPGSARLEDLSGLDEIIVMAPPGTVERRYVLALALAALKPGGTITALAPKDKGGSRLAGDLRAMGGDPEDTPRAHHRICKSTRPVHLRSTENPAIAAGSLTFRDDIGLWTQAGVFSWDRIDPGSALLAANLPALAGAGADFGCGIGFLSRKVLEFPSVTELHLIDTDRLAMDAAAKNVTDPRAQFHWADVVQLELPTLDFVVSNPPFHEIGLENKSLGQQFIVRAAQVLKTGGKLYLVANRHLPYEAVLTANFKSLKVLTESGGYKVFEAVK